MTTEVYTFTRPAKELLERGRLDGLHCGINGSAFIRFPVWRRAHADPESAADEDEIG